MSTQDETTLAEQLDQAAEELHRTPPEDFVTARAAQVAQARGGQPGAGGRRGEAAQAERRSLSGQPAGPRRPGAGGGLDAGGPPTALDAADRRLRSATPAAGHRAGHPRPAAAAARSTRPPVLDRGPAGIRRKSAMRAVESPRRRLRRRSHRTQGMWIRYDDVQAVQWLTADYSVTCRSVEVPS